LAVRMGPSCWRHLLESLRGRQLRLRSPRGPRLKAIWGASSLAPDLLNCCHHERSEGSEFFAFATSAAQAFADSRAFTAERVRELLFRPAGACLFRTFPTACAVGCILTPLRG